MCTYNLQLKPRDLLFMHDARPMEASDAGLGAEWPRPDQLGNAIINAFHHQWPDMQDWEGDRHTVHEGDKPNSSFRFGALKTAGPFPVLKGKDGENTVFFPCPLDVSADANGILNQMILVDANNMNMPQPLTKAFQAKNIGKQSLPTWISAGEYAEYLAGKPFAHENVKLYSAERNFGVAFDPETGTAREHQLYQAEYLRLTQNVSLGFKASCILKPKHRPYTVDVFEKLSLPAEVIIGGQQGVARMERLDDGLTIPKTVPTDSLFVRWTLLTPLVSPTGWMPSWVDAKTGKIKLLRRQPRRLGESREEWRKRVHEAPSIDATLIAARIGKPITFSGWDLQDGGPKPTVLAVPAGSSYVFQCGSATAVQELWNALDCQSSEELVRLSSRFGERGFGLGVCSSIDSSNIR